MPAVQWFKIETKLQCEEYATTMHCSVTRGGSDGDDNEKSWKKDLLAVGGNSSQAAYGEPRRTSIASTRRTNDEGHDVASEADEYGICDCRSMVVDEANVQYRTVRGHRH